MFFPFIHIDDSAKLRCEHGRGPVRINDSNGSLVMALFPNMPSELRSSLLENLKASFPDEPHDLEHLGSSQLPTSYRFDALHFSWYNRYGTRVSGLSLVVKTLIDVYLWCVGT